MTEIRFSYNPFTKDFIKSNLSHSVAIYNAGKQKQFDEYIRGIIIDNELYLRTYYPFDDLSELSITELKQKSYELTHTYYLDILKMISIAYGLKPSAISYNVENDLLQGIGLANI